MADQQHIATTPEARVFIRFEKPTRIRKIDQDNIPAGSFMFLGRAIPKDEDTFQHAVFRHSPLILWAHLSFDPRGPDFPHRQEFTDRFQRCILKTQADEDLSDYRIEWSSCIGQLAVIVPHQMSRQRQQLPQVMACLLPCEGTRPQLAVPGLAGNGLAATSEESRRAGRAYSARAVEHFTKIMHLRDPLTAVEWRGVSFFSAVRLASEEHVEIQARWARQKIRNHWRDFWMVKKQLRHVAQRQLQRQADGSSSAEESDYDFFGSSSEWEVVSSR